MQAFMQQAAEFSAAMAYLAKMAIAAKHAPKEIYAEIQNAEALAEAYQDAKIAAAELNAMGQAHIIGCMMEAIESAS